MTNSSRWLSFYIILLNNCASRNINLELSL
jgi:hypothetical protein